VFETTAKGDCRPLHLVGNLWGGGATPALQQSWGQLKARCAPSHGPTSQAPTSR